MPCGAELSEHFAESDMGRALTIVVLIMISAAGIPTKSGAKEPVKCAFGLCLGEKWNGEHLGTPIDAIEWKIRPPLFNPVFAYYSVIVVPSTGAIAGIIGHGTESRDKSACSFILDLKSALEAKYGTAKEEQKSGSLISAETYIFGNALRTIKLQCATVDGGKSHYLSVFYTDEELWKKAIHESSEKDAESLKRGL